MNAEMKCRPLFVFVLSVLLISGCKPTPVSLMTAVKADNTEEAKSLIGKGADANSRTSPNGWSALHYAARNGNVEVVQQLLNSGADPNYSGSMDGQANSAAAMKPLVLARISLEVVSQVPTSEIEKKLHESGLDDPVLLKSLQDPTAVDRYTKVVDLLTKVTK
ncbi:MAG: ankyrin repeat domain-containing protein [Terracidiphilus sp.]